MHHKFAAALLAISNCGLDWKKVAPKALEAVEHLRRPDEVLSLKEKDHAAAAGAILIAEGVWYDLPEGAIEQEMQYFESYLTRKGWGIGLWDDVKEWEEKLAL